MRHRVDKTMAGTVAIASACTRAQGRETGTTPPSRNRRAMWHFTTIDDAANRWSRRRSRPPNAPWRGPGQRGERPPLSRLTLTGAHAHGSSASTGSRSPLCPGVCPSSSTAEVRPAPRAAPVVGHHGRHFRAALSVVKARRMAPPARAASALTAPRCSPDLHLRDGQEDRLQDARTRNIPSTSHGEDDGMNDEQIREHNSAGCVGMPAVRVATRVCRCCDVDCDRGES
jgi:hypothetical protein